jgi:hypothetical protein
MLDESQITEVIKFLFDQLRYKPYLIVFMDEICTSPEEKLLTNKTTLENVLKNEKIVEEITKNDQKQSEYVESCLLKLKKNDKQNKKR